jgi:hypothetical protein
MMATVGFLLLLAMAGTPHVAPRQVFKCVDGGQVAYQSLPCAGPPAKAWTVPRLPLAAGPSRVPRTAMRAEPRSRRTAPARRNVRPVDDACATARKGRAMAYRKAGLKRGFALSSHWDNRVHEACW